MAVVSGHTKPKPRLMKVEVDLGRGEYDFVPIEVYGLRTVRVLACTGSPSTSLVQVWRENEFRLLPGNEVDVPAGEYRRLWLRVSSEGSLPGVYSRHLVLSSGEGPPLELPIRVTVWNVPLPAVRLPTKYYAFLGNMGTPYKSEDLLRIKALLHDLARLRSTTCDWAYPLNELVRRARIAETGELLTAAARAGRVNLNSLCRLDLSAFDQWVAASAAMGMTRFEINVDSVNSLRELMAIKEATWRELDPNTEEGWRVVLWLYSELRRYALSRGMESTWAKVDDEIPPEQIPAWIAGASRFRSIGYHTYTTITNAIPRNEAWLNAMNPVSDGWQVSIVTSRIFSPLPGYLLCTQLIDAKSK